jgi:hypothetical protein
VTTRKPKTPKKPKKKARRPANEQSVDKLVLRPAKLAALRSEIARARGKKSLARWNADPEDVQRSVAQLVLALVEFLRKLLERQAIRRMEGETLDPEEIERIGLALMQLEETVSELAKRFGLEPSDLNLDLGPLGRLS